MKNEWDRITSVSKDLSQSNDQTSFKSQPIKSEFEGKVVLITGGTSGIGRATALTFARAGAKVVVAGRNETEGEKTIDKIKSKKGEGIFIRADISKAEDVEAMVKKTVETYKRLDCAFNNAGVTKTASLVDFSEQDWDRIVNVNLKGMWLSLKYEIQEMLKQGGGVIVNMASAVSVVGLPGTSIYSASKGGVVALSRAAAMEYAQSNIRINAISPAIVQTSILDGVSKEWVDALAQKHPIGRVGQPEDIAEAVCWLCSLKSSFMTGQNIVLDGGYTAQ